jgi:hypothetical protein
LSAADADTLAGKWSTKKATDQGQITLTLEVKKDKFVFETHAGEDRLVLHAEGDLKLEKLGPFNLARFTNIRAGEGPSDLQDVDDDYASVYTLDEDTWTLATNFDKPRNQRPSLDVFKRMKPAPRTGILVIDEIEMADTPQSSTWYFCFDAEMGAASRRYYVENKGYDKTQVTIPVAIELPEARVGQKCRFKMQLDDIDADVCTEEVDNRSKGEFVVSERGSQTYKPEDNWRYTIRWHLK